MAKFERYTNTKAEKDYFRHGVLCFQLFVAPRHKTQHCLPKIHFLSLQVGASPSFSFTQKQPFFQPRTDVTAQVY